MKRSIWIFQFENLLKYDSFQISCIHTINTKNDNYIEENKMTQTLLFIFTNNYKELESNTLNLEFWSRKAEIVFSCKTYFNNDCF